jgi:hypothetical protein
VPNINDAFPSNYLKASDLAGRQAVVTMDRVEFEPVGREREMKAVLYFVGKQKGMVLNKTNAKKITDITQSALTEEWPGHAIVLYPTETEFGGETVECIRIKPVAKQPSRMTPAPTPVSRRSAPAAVAQPVVAVVESGDDHAGPLNEDEIPF